MAVTPDTREYKTSETMTLHKRKSVFCFAIAPKMRGKGIAGLLLSRVCEDAEKAKINTQNLYFEHDIQLSA